MKLNLTNIVIFGAIGYIAYRELIKKPKGRKVIEAAKETIEEATGEDLFDEPNRELVEESACAKKAEGMEFADDEQKYAWIVNCTQSYASANGAW